MSDVQSFLPRDHWVVRYSALFAVIISVVAFGAKEIADGATINDRVASLERRADSIKDRTGRLETKVAEVDETVGEIKQQSADTNETVHQILDKMLHR